MKSYHEILENIFSAYPMYHKIGSSAYKEGLENIEELLNILDNPQQGLKCVHVAGSNGKGSVSALLASYFQELGYKTGLFTSPHLVDFRERIRINGQMIPENDVVKFFDINQEKFQHLEPSFFEITTALAFDYFHKQNVDIAIVEVGLGGRLDATNVIKPLLSVITNISLEHTQLLGDSIAKIAAEKAGIIKEKTPVVIGEFNPESFPVFEDIANAHNAPLFLADSNYSIQSTDNGFVLYDSTGETVASLPSTPLGGEYQLKNTVTFMQCVKVLEFVLNIQKDVFADAVQNVIKNTGLMGRWQRLSDSPVTICDVGHNLAGLQYSMPYIRREKPAENSRIHVVFGMVKDKDIDNIVKILPKDYHYYVCCAQIERAMDPSVLTSKMETAGLECTTYGSVATAVGAAKANAKRDDVILITGSCFVVGEALQIR